MFLNSLHSIFNKRKTGLGMICECKQPYNNDVIYDMLIGFFFNAHLCPL